MRLLALASLVAIAFAQYEINDFDERTFRARLNRALENVRIILDTTRNPQLAESDDRKWVDMYDTAEHITSVAISVEIGTLMRMLDIEPAQVQTLQEWSHQRDMTVVLRFESALSCTFLGEEEVVETGGVEYETIEETGGSTFGGKKSKTTTKIVTKHTDYSWQALMTYQIHACPNGNCRDPEAMDLVRHERSTVITTRSPKAPFMDDAGYDPLDLDATWLIRNIELEGLGASFKIDREKESCKTPTRNIQIEEAVKFQDRLGTWCTLLTRRLEAHSSRTVGTIASSKASVLRGMSIDGIFAPILPLMVNGTSPDLESTSTLLAHHIRTVEEAADRLFATFQKKEDTNVLISYREASLFLLALHLEDLSRQFRHGVAFLERTLEKKLGEAIGTELTTLDFVKFMHFHNRKFFAADYVPVPFSHAIRKPGRYPDGVLSIEDQTDLMMTLVRRIPGTESSPIRIPINAATEVHVTGDKYLHGWLDHRFEHSQLRGSTKLIARARQFSSFLLIIGKMESSDQLKPEHAIILQNKDEVLIPLLSEALPSAKEFRDAIVSLSPEQQEFARAFRQMQLESSVFAVCIVQLKPQIEKVLGLPDGALTKEIQLTQDLMSLFVDYQIPPDLLSYDGASTVVVEDQVEAVRAHVEGVIGVINGLKKKQLREETEKADMRAEMVYATSASYATVPNEMLSVSFNSVPPTGSPSARPSMLRAQAPSGIPSASPSSVPSSLPSFVPSEAPSARPSRLHAQEMTTSEASDTIQAEPQTREKGDPHEVPHSLGSPDTVVDFTMIPKLLDAQLEQHDSEGALRSTVISVKPQDWKLVRQQNLLSAGSQSILSSKEIASEYKKAMDLLDAISRSGSLSLQAAELHVLVGVTHSFEKSIIETLVQENINPIAKVERSMLMLAAVIYGEPAGQFVADGSDRDRLEDTFPALFRPVIDAAQNATSAE